MVAQRQVTGIDDIWSPDVAVLDHYVTIDNDDAATHCIALRQLIDRIAPAGSRKTGTLFVPPKFASDPVKLTRDGANAWCIDVPSNVTIKGAGRGSAFEFPAGMTTSVRAFRVQGKEHVRISGIAVDGNRANNPSNVEHNHCIFVYDSEDVAVNDCYLHGATGDGLSISGSVAKSRNVRADGNVIEDNRRNGITVEQVDIVKITRNEITAPSDATGSVIDFEPFSDVVCSDAYISGNTLTQLDDTKYLVTLSGRSSTYPFRNIRFVENNLSGGILNIIAVERVLVRGNQGTILRILANAYSRGVRITDNDLAFTFATLNSGAVDIQASLGEWPERVLVAGNDFTIVNNVHGIFVRGAERVKIAHNDLTGPAGSTQSAIRIEATREMERVVITGNDCESWAQAVNATPNSTNRVRSLVMQGNVADTMLSATEPAFELYTLATLGSDFRVGGNIARNSTSGVTFAKYSGDTVAAWDQA